MLVLWPNLPMQSRSSLKSVSSFKQSYFEVVNVFAIFLAENNLGKYFQENWFNCTEMWAMVHRSSVMTIGNNTTNHIERYVNVLKSPYGLKAIASTP
jgi:hypothetical protein